MKKIFYRKQMSRIYEKSAWDGSNSLGRPTNMYRDTGNWEVVVRSQKGQENILCATSEEFLADAITTLIKENRDRYNEIIHSYESEEVEQTS